LLAAAVRVLAARKPERGVDILLTYLPDNASPEVEGEIVRALTVLGVTASGPDPALVRALKDPRPVCRAIAAEVLGGIDHASHRADVRKLLADPDRAVRLHVAVSLVNVREKEAVPVLIELLADLPKAEAWAAENLLRRLAGAAAPRPRPGEGEAERKQYRDDWNRWWKEHGATVNLAQLDAGPPRKVKASARASATWKSDVTPDKPFDLDQPTTWNAGGYAPQWIEADVGSSSQLASIRLTVTQSPDGPTTHEVWVSQQPIGEDRRKAKLAHTFNGPTQNLQALKFDFPLGMSARYVQIRTTQSPSWVAWAAIEMHVGRTRPSFVKAVAK